MFRTTRTALSALALAAMVLPGLAEAQTTKLPPAPKGDGAGGATEPGAVSNGNVRDHRKQSEPTPAPRPARTSLSREPAQWEIRNITGIKADEPYSIYNLRRDELDLSSKLTFKKRDGDDATGWGLNGGDFIFKRDTASTSVRDHRPIRDGEFVAIYNTKTKRYMQHYGSWNDKPQYIWMVKKQDVVTSGRQSDFHFALFNTAQRKWLMLCQNEDLKPADKEWLCLYNDKFEPVYG